MFNLCWIKTKVFSILIKDFFFSPSHSNPNTGIIRFLHSWLINLLIMHGSESKAHWCFCVSSSSLCLLSFCLALEINGWSCRAQDTHAYRMGSHTLSHTHTHRGRAATKRLAKQKWEVMSHIWIFLFFSPRLSGKGQGRPPEAWQPTVPLRQLCQVSNISLGKSSEDKMVASFFQLRKVCYYFLSDPVVVSACLKWA